MQVNVTVQDGIVWLDEGLRHLELHPRRLFGSEGRGPTP
jgi:hypothetical protein